MSGDMSTMIELMELFYGGEKGVGLMGQFMGSFMNSHKKEQPKQEVEKKVIGGVAAGAPSTRSFSDALKEAVAEIEQKHAKEVQPDIFEEAIKNEVASYGIKEGEAEYFAKVVSVMAEDVREMVEQEKDPVRQADLAKQAAAQLVSQRRATYAACREIIENGTEGLSAMFRDNQEGLSAFLNRTELTTLYYEVKQAELSDNKERLAQLNEKLKKRCEDLATGNAMTREDKAKQVKHQTRRGR